MVAAADRGRDRLGQAGHCRLQELGVGRARSGGADQAEMIVLSARHEGAVLSRAPGDGRALSRRHPTACPSRLIDRANVSAEDWS